MKKMLISLACIIVFIMGLFLVSCEKQETATKAEVPAADTSGHEAPAATDVESAAGGYGEEAPAETGGY